MTSQSRFTKYVLAIYSTCKDYATFLRSANLEKKVQLIQKLQYYLTKQLIHHILVKIAQSWKQLNHFLSWQKDNPDKVPHEWTVLLRGKT